MSAVETPAVTAAVFIHHHQNKTPLDIGHFATSSEQQHEYVQILRDFPGWKKPGPWLD